MPVPRALLHAQREPPRRCVVVVAGWAKQVFADALTLGLMCYASFLDSDDDSETLELVYAGALLVQVRQPSQQKQ